MRLSETHLAALRTKPKTRAAYLRLDRTSSAVNSLFTGSWTFFPMELGEAGDGVVAILGFTQLAPELDPDLEWVGIEHQSGGYSCSHPVFIGVRLALRPHIAEWLHCLAKDYLHHKCGYFCMFEPKASDIEAYNTRLKTVGLHCEETYPWLHEAVYPIDATPETLSILSATPPEIERFGDCHFRSPLAAGPRGSPNFGVFVLAQNSD